MLKNSSYILSICIPTYNRAKDLEYNLSLLESYIEYANLLDKVCLVISNNCSTDDTDFIIKHYVDRGKLCVHYYRQDHNIGAGSNQVYTVEKADTPWVMLLGDDDYLESWYIGECLKLIDEHTNLGCIIPNYAAYDPLKEEELWLREENCKTEYYHKGFTACKQNSWRAHQLSGLCFRRDGVVEKYHKNHMNNLYPQIFFISYCCLHYDVLHFGQKCLRVSSIPQSNKDWNYGDDGLVNDIFENYKYLGVSLIQRAILEADFLRRDARYAYLTNNQNLAVEKILEGRNVSRLGRILIAWRISRRKCYSGKKYHTLFIVLNAINRVINILAGKK